MTQRVIDGKYELLAPIGRGGMSVVWLARDRRLDKLWAVKEIKPDVGGEQGQANRRAILDEANFMKRLDHPAIPRVVDIIEDGPVAYVVMDYVEGVSLGRALREHGPFAQEEVARWGAELCDVLGYLHARQPPVVYRDMKPGNVMLREDGSVRLIDFGIATELGPTGDRRIIGSCGYSAPEQVDPRARELHPLDTRADVYALGATLHSLVTGEVPRRVVRADGTEALELDLRPIRELDPTLSDGLERVILTATRNNPDERYQAIEDMRYDLEHYEDLTQGHRAAQRRRLVAFARRAAGAVASAALGVLCLIGSVQARNGSYDALVHEAAVAGTEEQSVQVAEPARGGQGSAEASEAERLYTQAVEVEPGRLSTYEALVATYKADQVFTPTESQRWMRLWQIHGRDVEGDERYARLCYDVGVLYLCYYDYLDSGDTSTAGSGSSGQGAIESATRSCEWFSRARAACHPEEGDYCGLEVGDVLDEYAATVVYEQIGQFHTRFTQDSREGRDMTETYRDFWEGLVEVVRGTGGAMPVVERSEPIVRLRLYQVAFEALASPTYLSGLRLAGITEEDVDKLLLAVKARVDALAGFVSSNRVAAGAIYDEIEGGYEGACDNVTRTYGGPVALVGGRVGAS